MLAFAAPAALASIDATTIMRPLNPMAGKYQVEVENTSDIGYINTFNWVPPSQLTITAITSSQRCPKWCARGSAPPTSASLATRRASGPSVSSSSTSTFSLRSIALEAAAREEQRLAADDRAVALVDRRRDDQVHLAVLVLEQHEDDALRGRRALARDRHARRRRPARRAGRR